MGMTMTQKILASHAGLPEVHAGQLIEAKLDLVLGNDITAPVAINEFEANGFSAVFDRRRGARRVHHEPQLRRPHGTYGERGLSGLSRRRRRLRHRRTSLPS